MRCAVCGRMMDAAMPNNREYWQRRFPDVVVCHDCFFAPGDVEDYLKRKTIAHLIWHAHSISKAEAHAALNSLRGTGIPPNPYSGRRKAHEPPKKP